MDMLVSKKSISITQSDTHTHTHTHTFNCENKLFYIILFIYVILSNV